MKLSRCGILLAAVGVAASGSPGSSADASSSCHIGHIEVSGVATYIKGNADTKGSIFATCQSDGLVKCYRFEGRADARSAPEVSCDEALGNSSHATSTVGPAGKSTPAPAMTPAPTSTPAPTPAPTPSPPPTSTTPSAPTKEPTPAPTPSSTPTANGTVSPAPEQEQDPKVREQQQLQQQVDQLNQLVQKQKQIEDAQQQRDKSLLEQQANQLEQQHPTLRRH